MQPLARHMEELGVTMEALTAASGLEAARVKSIVEGNYTPDPVQRQKLAAALGLSIEEIAWGHAVPVDHMYGHGPQFGRSP